MPIGTHRFRTSFLCAIVIGLFLNVQYLYAAGSVKVRILDKSSGEPLIGANVIVLNTSLGAAANVDGIVNIYGVPAGEQTLKISYIGYLTVTLEVIVPESGVLEQEVRLSPQAIEGETVTITAQAQGQLQAINQQLASNTISNIVASDRIKELPDVSAAESIGRLPGISIDRYNGEATAVAIRGLAPKYNTVTVNGVALPATDYNNRTVDLSLVSSNVLDGIEVKKANTPDMDADALGGTIDLRLKEAPEEYQVNATAQYGANKLSNYYGNHSLIFGASRRFFDSKLGVIFGLNSDRTNRYADKLNVNWTGQAISGSNVQILQYTNATRRRDETFKDRFGGNLLLDFTIPHGKLTGNGFYNRARTSGTYRSDQLSITGGHSSRYYTLDDNSSENSIFTSSVGAMQDFGWIKYDAAISVTGSKTDDPEDRQWQFTQEDAAAQGTTVTPTTPLEVMLDTPIVTPNPRSTGIKSVYINSTFLHERQQTAQFNFQIPFKVSSKINGYFKTGGKFKWLSRTFNQEQWGRDNLQYGNSWSSAMVHLLHGLESAYPGSATDTLDFIFARDSALIRNTAYWNLYRFNTGYKVPLNYLGGGYNFGMSPDLGLMQKVLSVFRTLGGTDWQRQSIGSMGHDYDGVEQYQAGYVMAEIKLGPYVTFTPGVRYDQDYTRYNGQSFQEITQSGTTLPPMDLRTNQNIRRNSFWLPMVHLKLHPFEWMYLFFASTQTLTRPDYNMYAPITTLDQYSSYIQAANGSLRDSKSKNVDASLSIIQKYAGLVTVSGFYKSISDLILYQSVNNVDTVVYKTINAELNILPRWLNQAPIVATWMNNPTPAYYRGVEFDWQTNFWYLPQPFTGLVFNLNWTYINSSIDVRQYKVTINLIADPTDPTHRRRIKQYIFETPTRTQRMPDQPAHILNLTGGYDYKGFSIRVSYLYQSDKVTGVGLIPFYDSFVDKYDRWDISVQQRLGRMIQLYANFNNITNTHDESLLGYQKLNPTDIQYYGSTIDFGVRFNL